MAFIYELDLNLSFVVAFKKRDDSVQDFKTYRVLKFRDRDVDRTKHLDLR